MKKLSNTEAELKKALLIKKAFTSRNNVIKPKQFCNNMVTGSANL